MWKIELTNRDDSLETIGFHSSFISLDKISTFSLSPVDKRFDPVEINFIAKKDKAEKDFLVKSSNMENNSMTITYYNPGIGLSGLKEPMIILENDVYFFKIMFNTNLLRESNAFLLTIEFFIQKK